jgi:MULE transposase domain/SWIM zinc finger
MVVTLYFDARPVCCYSIYSLGYVYTMDPKLLDSVTNIIKSKGNQWEPKCINVNTSGGTVNLMDYLSGGKELSSILLFDNAHSGTDPNDKMNRKPIIAKLRNACAEAGFELASKGWEKARKRIVFCCSRGFVFTSQKVSETPRDSKTTRPMEECEKCPFGFTVHWLEDSNCWAIKGGNGCRFHCGHVQKEETEVRKLISDFPEEQLDVIKDCLSTNVGTGVAGAILKKRTGLNLSRGQLYTLGLSSQKVPQDDSWNNQDLTDGSPAEKLIHYLESTPNISCVLLYDHPDSKLVTVRKPSKKEISLTQAVTSEVVTECILPGHQQQAAAGYIKSLRKSLMVDDNQKILLAAAWISDEERRLVSLYPEVLGVDITEQTNKEKRPLIILAGLTGDNKTYTAARALLPSAQGWVFKWFFETVLPALIPQKARERNTVMFTDGDELEYNAFTNAIKDYFPNSCHHLCTWHLFNRNLKMKSGYPCVSESTDSKTAAYVHVIESWIKSWFNYIETIEEYEISKELLLMYLNSPPAGVTQGNIFFIRDWIINNLEPHAKKCFFAHFLYKQTFERVSTQFVEAENSVLKSNKLGTRPCQSIHSSAKTQHSMSERRLEKDNKMSAIQVDQLRVSYVASEFKEINGIVNNVGFNMVIAQYNCSRNYESYRQNESTFLVKALSPEAELPPTHLQEAKYINYMVPKFERTRIVNIFCYNGKNYLECSCGYFNRMGLPCRHMYSILKRKPLPCDLILRYHTQFHYFYQKQIYLDVNDCYNNILCDNLKGPIVEAGKLDDIPITKVIPNAVIAALPGNIPILHKNCK